MRADDLLSNNMYQGKLSKSELYYFLKLSTSESSFIFDNILYKQIHGVSMGSTLGPTLANAFLCRYEILWLLIVHQNSNLLYTKDISTAYLFCLSPKIISYCLLDILTLGIKT